MVLRSGLAVLMWVLILTPTWATTPASAQFKLQLDRCIDSLFHHGDTVNRNADIQLSKQCPELASADFQALLKNLEPPLTDETTLAQLQDTRAALSYLAGPATSQRSFNYQQLKNVLDATYIERKTPELELSIWERFKQWLKEWLTPQDTEAPAWLIEFLDSINIPDGVAEFIFKGSMVVLIIIALLIIFNELRAANILTALRRTRSKRRQQILSPELLSTSAMTLDQIALLDGNEQTRALLYYLLVHLMNKGVIPENFSLTNRELLDKSKQQRPDLFDSFSRFINFSDDTLYGGKHPASAQRSQAVQLVKQIKDKSEPLT